MLLLLLLLFFILGSASGVVGRLGKVTVCDGGGFLVFLGWGGGGFLWEKSGFLHLLIRCFYIPTKLICIYIYIYICI